ncbi:MAG: gas vesicle protein GvpH [Haloglomus sp.]
MTPDDNSDGTDDENGEDWSGSIPLGDVFESLSDLLDRLEELDIDESERRSDTIRRGDATFDYNINIGSINPAGESRRRRSRTWDIRGESADHEYRVQVDEEGGEIVVVADLPAVSPDEVEVATNDETGALEIRVDGEVVESVALDWDGAAVTDVTFQNQILEVRVAPPGATDDEEGEESADRGDDSTDGGDSA